MEVCWVMAIDDRGRLRPVVGGTLGRRFQAEKGGAQGGRYRPV